MRGRDRDGITGVHAAAVGERDGHFAGVEREWSACGFLDDASLDGVVLRRLRRAKPRTFSHRVLENARDAEGVRQIEHAMARQRETTIDT